MSSLLDKAKALDVKTYRKSGHKWGAYWPATLTLLRRGMTLTDIFDWLIDPEGGAQELTEEDRRSYTKAMSKRKLRLDAKGES